MCGHGSNWHIVTGALGSGAPPLVVNLCRRDVPVAEEVLHFADVHVGIEEQGSRGRPERMRRVDAKPSDSAINGGLFLDSAWELLQIALDQ